MCYEVLQQKYRPLENPPLGKPAPVSPMLNNEIYYFVSFRLI